MQDIRINVKRLNTQMHSHDQKYTTYLSELNIGAMSTQFPPNFNPTVKLHVKLRNPCLCPTTTAPIMPLSCVFILAV